LNIVCGAILIDVFAHGCGPPQALLPALESIATDFAIKPPVPGSMSMLSKP
jgi:hypothetical protein